MNFKHPSALTGMLFLLTTVSLCGCNPEISQGKKALEGEIKDPGSVQYKDVVAYSENVICGQYNAKNELGGYAGFKQFVTLKGELIKGDEHANFMMLCNNTTKNKTEVDVFSLGHQRLEDIEPQTGKKRSWSVNVDIWVNATKKATLWQSKKELADIAYDFLLKSEKGLSSWADQSYVPERSDVTEQALLIELQKHVKDVEIKRVRLVAY